MTVRTPRSTDVAAWRIAAEVDWRTWNGEVVAYNGRSGDTHHFADFAGWAFAQLAAAPATAAALAATATDDVELRCGLPEETVERTLALFRELDLLEPIG